MTSFPDEHTHVGWTGCKQLLKVCQILVWNISQYTAALTSFDNGDILLP